MQVIAIPTVNRDLPESVQRRLDQVKTILERIGNAAYTINEWVTNIWATLDAIIRFLPDWLTDDTKSVEDRVFSATAGKAVARRVTWYVKIADEVRAKTLELKETLVAVQLDVEQVIKYIEMAESLADMEVIDTEKHIDQCVCSKGKIMRWIEWVRFEVIGEDVNTGDYQWRTIEGGMQAGSPADAAAYVQRVSGSKTATSYQEVEYRVYALEWDTPTEVWQAIQQYLDLEQVPEKRRVLLNNPKKNV